MKILIKSRMRIRYALQGVVYLEYKVKGSWGYVWRKASVCLELPNEDYRTTLKRLQRLRAHKRSERKSLVQRMTTLYCKNKELELQMV
ncbi:hypothetical protein ACWA1C_12940 [Flectobacillus roseus]